MDRTIRPPCVAGTFYPGNRKILQKAVEKYLDDAGETTQKNVRAVIAPHAGYVYSGPTAGYAFKALQSSIPSDLISVYVLAPAHRAWFKGVAVSDQDFSTPLGISNTDRVTIDELCALGTHYELFPKAHDDEHSLEVQLPFLQMAIPQFELVPLLFGEVDACSVGKELAARLHEQPDARLVVSSDLSHFNDYRTAQSIDSIFIHHVLEGDLTAVEKDTQGACGRLPIVTLMQIAKSLNWTPHLLDYRNSGDTAGDKHRVVGYAAIAYTEAGGD